MANDNLPNIVISLLASKGTTYVSLETEASGPGNTFAFERDDYTPESMEIVNRMAVDTVGESQNIHKLVEQRVIVPITQNNGKPSPISDGGPGSVNSYTAILSDGEGAKSDSSGVRNFQKLSNSEQFFGLNNEFEVIKGNANPTSINQRNYLTLLVDYNKKRSSSTLAQAVGELQSKNNRFSETNKFIIDGQKEDESGVNVIPIQNIPGQHTPQVWPNTKTGTNVELQNLKNLGAQILLKATGEYNVPDNPYVRLGDPLPMSEIQVDNIVNEVNPEFSINKSPSLSGTPTFSHGSYYSPLAPFDSFDAQATIDANAILVATVAGIVNDLARNSDNESKLGVAATYFKKYEPSFKNGNQDPTLSTAEYINCVNKGFRVFLSLEGNSTVQGNDNNLKALDQAPGYYNTILRGIVKMVRYDIVNNLFGIIDQESSLGTGGQTANSNLPTNRDLDINRNINQSNDYSNLGKILRSFADSKLLNFINILAQLGDNALTLENAGIAPDSSTNPLKVGKSDFDYTFDVIEENRNTGAEYLPSRRINPASLIKKHRLSVDAAQAIGHSTEKMPLAWANTTTPSTYLLPKTITNAADQLSDNGSIGLTTKLSGINGITKYDSGNRLPSEMVDKIERLLDASYMPFYFHDLRTNEIISFHAFLESISDNFSAEYNEQTAYGRIGKISTYKNTDRSISLSFLTVATNNRDFDEMWWKINKLITMVYPQYTKGREIQRGNQKFIQPFSQLPSASPLIRLRLGDLIKTNYSKFHLARLFGLGESDKFFNIQPAPVVTQEQIKSIELQDQARNNIRTRLAAGKFLVGDKFIYGGEGINPDPLPNNPQYINTTLRDSIDGATPSTNRERGRLLRRARRTPRQVRNNPDFGSVGTITKVLETGYNDGINAPIVYEATFDGREGVHYIYPTNYLGSITSIDVDTDYLEQQVRKLVPIPPSPAPDLKQEVRNFFNDSNPIFQSFNTVRGKGLPGFIKSIEFDWSEMMWETTNGSKAPKTCKISISFAPIWDINPGIDSNGFNIAPVYGIGQTTNDLAKTYFGDDNASSDVMRYQALAGSSEPNNNFVAPVPSSPVRRSVITGVPQRRATRNEFVGERGATGAGVGGFIRNNGTRGRGGL